MGYPVVVYVYPERNEAFRNIVTTVPPKKGNQAAVRFLMLFTWKAAAKEVEDWIEKSGGTEAHMRKKFSRAVQPPIPDNNQGMEKVSYRAYMDEHNQDHSEFLEYLQALPSGRAKQVFLQTAMVRSYEAAERIVKLITIAD